MSKKPITLPGRDGRVEEGERLIADPYNPARKTTVTVNVRESAIDHMRSRGRVDETQAAVADRFRKLWELAAIGHQRGIDFANGGGGSGYPADPLTDELVRAGRDLARCIRQLGMVRSQILISIVGEGKRIEDVAKDWSKSGGAVRGDRAEGYVTGTLIDAIDELTSIWRMEGAPRPTKSETTWWRKGAAVTVNDFIRSEEIQSPPNNSPQRSTEIYIARDGTVMREEVRPIDRAQMPSPHESGNLRAHGSSNRKR